MDNNAATGFLADEETAEIPLHEERRRLERHLLHKGATCRACGRRVKAYGYRFTEKMAHELAWFAYMSGPERKWVHVGDAPKWMLQAKSYSSLRWWGLLESAGSDPEDRSKTSRGLWRPTDDGLRFLRRQLRVHERAVVYNNTFLGYDGPALFITEVLPPTGFDFEKLMAWRPSGQP